MAIDMREYAYTPYSGFDVGAALPGADGKIYTCFTFEQLLPEGFGLEKLI